MWSYSSTRSLVVPLCLNHLLPWSQDVASIPVVKYGEVVSICRAHVCQVIRDI